jgi:ribonuclease D
MTTLLITDAAALEQHCARWREKPWIAVDTEFVRVDTYYARPCLAQVSDGAQSVCIDLIALSQQLAPFFAVLHAPGVVKVLHSAGQDNEIFSQIAGDCPRPLFDTQVAATLLGIGDQIGYAPLIENLLGIAVDKSLSRTDWTRRPLAAAELAYAAADVEHLATVYPGLRQRLVDTGRLAWLEEDCARLADPAQYRADPAEAWQRLRGLARLPPREQALAAQLAAWRETEAQQRDRPRKWILEDDAIYRMAQRRPSNFAQLQALQVLPPKTLDRHGKALLEVIAAAPSASAPLATDDSLSSEQKQRLQALQDQARKIAEELKVPVSYLAPRAALLALLLKADGAADLPLLRGWRLAAAGERLKQMLD